MTTFASPGIVPVITRAQRLRIAREHAGYNQCELADAIGMSRETVGRAERGERVLRVTIRMWALACGVDLRWLEEESGPPPAAAKHAKTSRPAVFHVRGSSQPTGLRTLRVRDAA